MGLADTSSKRRLWLSRGSIRTTSSMRSRLGISAGDKRDACMLYRERCCWMQSPRQRRLLQRSMRTTRRAPGAARACWSSSGRRCPRPRWTLTTDPPHPPPHPLVSSRVFHRIVCGACPGNNSLEMQHIVECWSSFCHGYSSLLARLLPWHRRTLINYCLRCSIEDYL